MAAAQPNQHDIASSPRWFPHALDPLTDQVVLVERSEADYRAAAFLDDRSLTPSVNRFAVQWDDLAGTMPPAARRDTRYIFHIGHVGSTLISRLLGELPAVLALREPLALRTFFEVAQLEGEPDSPWSPDTMSQRLDSLTALLSRTWRAEQRAIVKATSFTAEIAHRLVPADSKALLLYAKPERHLSNILAGDAARAASNFLAGSRLKRLQRRLGEAPSRLWEMSQGEKAGLAWACEMSALAQAERRLPAGSVRWLDFDAFLRAPGAGLAEAAAFVGVPLTLGDAERLCRGPLMSRYSKALEYEYSAGLREQILAESSRGNRSAIAQGMAWIEAAAKRHPVMADCLQRAA